MNELWKDVRHALQMFRKNPGFTIAAVAALALGIGANTAIFTVVNAVLLKPLAYPDPERMVRFSVHQLHGTPQIPEYYTSIPEYEIYLHRTDAFSEIAAYDVMSPGFALTGEHPEEVNGIHVTEGFFRLLGARPVIGRTFTKPEDSPHGGNVVVISYALWQRRLAGDPEIVGKSLQLGHEPYTIVGVIDKDFHSSPEAELWIPFQFDPGSRNADNFFQTVARLKPGVTIEQARGMMVRAKQDLLKLYPPANPAAAEQFEMALEPLQDAVVGDARRSLLMMLAAVSLVLLIACANVANLQLARATGRKREFAIRSALGAGRGRIIQQLLTESVLLAAAGGVLGSVLGFAGVRALLAISPSAMPRVGESGGTVGVDLRVLGFTLAVSLLTGVLFGLFPALSASKTDLNSALKESANRAGTGFRQGKARSMLVVSQVSLALLLLVGAVLLIRSFIALRNVGPGFETHNILTAEMAMSGKVLHTSAGIGMLARKGSERLNTIPGVEASGASVFLPTWIDDALPVHVVGRPPEQMCSPRWTSMSPGYLSVFKIPLLRGRIFTENDDLKHPLVALVTESLAKQCWPNQDPIGQRVLVAGGLGSAFEEPERTIVGVVADWHNMGVSRPTAPMLIEPTAQVVDAYASDYSDTQPLLWVMRTRTDPHAMIQAIKEQLRIASGGNPIARIRTMDEVLGETTSRQSFQTSVLTVFGVVALLLAAIGIYGLMAYSVEQRKQEMGIRMALGADREAIQKLVVWQGMKLAIAGVALGLSAAFGLTRLIASFLFGVNALDPTAFVAAPLILAAVALVAVWLPAARAAKIDPMQALRTE